MWQEAFLTKRVLKQTIYQQKSYECETSVLVLNSRTSNTSVLVSNFGQFHVEDEFIKGNWADNMDVQIFESCSVMRNGKITIFGGRENKRQMSVVENCEIRRVTTMPFEFRLGGCVTDDSEGKNIETHTASKAKDLNRQGA